MFTVSSKRFLTCGADGNAGIYNVLQKKPLVVVDPSLSYLMSVAWSNRRPMVFCVGSEDGTTHIYDLSHSMSAPLFSLPANANKEDTIESNEKASSTKQPSLRNNENISTTCVRFNPRLGTLLATSDSAGQVKIWKLSPSLATPRNDEESQLELFFKQFTDESDESAPPGGRKKKKKRKQNLHHHLVQMVVTIVKSKHAYHNNICGVIYYIMPLVLHHTHTHTFCIRTIYAFMLTIKLFFDRILM